MSPQVERLPGVSAEIVRDQPLDAPPRRAREDQVSGQGHWHQRIDGRGTLWLGLDFLGGAVNLVSREVLTELDLHLEAIAETPPKALILHSLKPRGFIAGADVSEFAGLDDTQEVAASIHRVHAILDRLEGLPCPTLALIHGFCLGGGLELALACRYRVASDDADTRIGFPEVRLGLFPGYGGTWRAIRNLGPLAALRIMLTGRTLSAREARRLGLVDLVVPQRQLEAAAQRLLAQGPESNARRTGLGSRLLRLAPLRRLAAAALERQTAARVQRDHYPAPFALIDHWRTAGSDRDALLANEARRVAELLIGDRAQGLIRVFQLQERLKGLGRSMPEAARIRRVQVIGAGVMGGDIAAWCALHGLQVGLQDLALDQISRALVRAQGLFRARLRDPRLVRDAWDRLMPDPRGDGLARADLVIEAVVEDSQVKRRLFQGLERQVRPEALLATNTSSIPLEEISTGLTRPERLIGLHFFNPVARMQLVEVVQGAATDPAAVARGLALVRALDHLPLPVQSSPGFLVNRVLMPYLIEAVDLLDEGVPAPVVDRAAVAFGMPMGPLALADAVGLDICLAVADRLGAHLSAPEEPPPRLRRMVQSGLLGRKGGEGFYRYRNGRALPGRIPWRYGGPRDLTERLVFRLLNECVACLREGVVADAGLLDAGIVFGTGFAPFRGGPLHYCERGGWGAMGERIADLERHHGGHFHPDLGWRHLVGAGV